MPSDINLVEALTKVTADAFKVTATYLERRRWVVRFNNDFVSVRKQQNLRKTKKLQEQSSSTQSSPEWEQHDEEFLEPQRPPLRD